MDQCRAGDLLMNRQRISERMGLRWRLIIGVSSLLVASSLLLSVFLLNEFSDAAHQSLEERGSSLARNFAHNAEFGIMLELDEDLEQLIDGMLTERDIMFAQAFSKQGQLLVRGINHDFIPLPFDTENLTLNAEEYDFNTDQQVAFKSLDADGDASGLEIVAPVYSQTANISKEQLGSATLSHDHKGSGEVIGYVRIGMSLEATEKKIAATQQMVIYFTLLLVMLGILLSVTLVKMLASPINTLVETTEKIAAGDLGQRASVKADAELERLAIAFNTMCDSLEKTQRELEVHNQNLERKVKERTRKLEEAQKQVIQSEKMAAVGQLAAGVAHELNNPLGGILGYAQFAMEQLKNLELGEEKARGFERYLSDIEVQARRCKMIVKNLLKFSRSSDKSEFGVVDVNAALEETFVFTSHQLGMKDIELETSLQEDLPPIKGNVNLLQQVFTNILINSMQSMPEGGKLTVVTRTNRPVGEFGGSVEVAFTDTGTGISDDIKSKIFEPFFTTKKVGEGTGLGLSVSYGIVRDHGGDIKIDSKVGEGSTFTVVLPILKQTAKTATV